MTLKTIPGCDRNKGRSGRPRLQRGQALAEMAVLAAVLVPIFLLIPMLGKYTYLKYRTHQAARAAAWAATVTPDYEWSKLKGSRALQEKLAIDRGFEGADAPIRTSASSVPIGSRLGDPLMNTFSGRELVERKGIELRPYRNESPGAITKLLDKFGTMIEKMPGEFPPNKAGLVTAELVVRPENLKTAGGQPARYLAPFDNIDLEIRSKHVLLADAWNAAGNGLEVGGNPSANRDRSVYRQVESIALLAMLDPVADLIDDMGMLEKVPLAGVPFRIRPGYMQPDIVPADKLKPYKP